MKTNLKVLIQFLPILILLTTNIHSDPIDIINQDLAEMKSYHDETLDLLEQMRTPEQRQQDNMKKRRKRKVVNLDLWPEIINVLKTLLGTSNQSVMKFEKLINTGQIPIQETISLGYTSEGRRKSVKTIMPVMITRDGRGVTTDLYKDVLNQLANTRKTPEILNRMAGGPVLLPVLSQSQSLFNDATPDRSIRNPTEKNALALKIRGILHQYLVQQATGKESSKVANARTKVSNLFASLKK